VHRELKALAEAGIIIAVQDGNRTYYRANESCPFFPELSGLMRKTGGLADALRRALAPVSKNVVFAFIYGSQAAGTATARSDVDLLVVGDVDDIMLHRAVSKAEDALGRTVNYTLLSRREFNRRRREKGGFLARVLASERIALIGEMDGP
jgi:predicted nucleotidyltransferase